MNKKQWLTKEEVAKELNVLPFFVTLLGVEGKIKVGETPGGTRRYDAESVKKYKGKKQP